MNLEESRGLGQNLQYFMDQVKIPARTAEQRQALIVYSNVMEILEKIAEGSLVISEPTEQEEGEQ